MRLSEGDVYTFLLVTHFTVLIRFRVTSYMIAYAGTRRSGRSNVQSYFECMNWDFLSTVSPVDNGNLQKYTRENQKHGFITVVSYIRYCRYHVESSFHSCSPVSTKHQIMTPRPIPGQGCRCNFAILLSPVPRLFHFPFPSSNSPVWRDFRFLRASQVPPWSAIVEESFAADTAPLTD